MKGIGRRLSSVPVMSRSTRVCRVIRRRSVLHTTIRCESTREDIMRAPSSVGRYDSARVDEGRKCLLLLAIEMKARTLSEEGGGGPAM